MHWEKLVLQRQVHVNTSQEVLWCGCDFLPKVCVLESCPTVAVWSDADFKGQGLFENNQALDVHAQE